MIINFIYKMNELNKRVITGMIVNDEIVTYDVEKLYNLVFEKDIKLKDNERIVSNYGKQYYAVSFDLNEYLNINNYMLTLKLNLSNNLSFASTASKGFLDEIINQTNNFNISTDIEYIDSGYTLYEDGYLKDDLEILFKKVTDNLYIELNYFKEPMFICKEDNDYNLTNDFAKAYRVLKKEIRPLLLIKGYVDTDTKKNDLIFSRHNILTDGSSYIYGKDNLFMLFCDDNNLKIINNPKITKDFKLLNDEKKNNTLRKISVLLKEEKENKGRLFSINDRYLKEIDKYSYVFVDNASKTNLIDYKDIEILKQVYLLFSDTITFRTEKQSNYYSYLLDTNHYLVSKEILDYKSRAISSDSYNNFINNINKKDITKGVVLLFDNRYLKLDLISNNEFMVSYLNSGLNASVVSIDMVSYLEEITGKEFKKKEVSLVFDGTKYSNIIKDDNIYSVKELYDNTIDLINSYDIKPAKNIIFEELKTSSTKSALEYLKYLYPKALLDAYKLFSRVLNEKTKKILFVGSVASAELEGLALACSDKKINVKAASAETVKWGMYPKCYLNSYVDYIGIYRLPFSSLPKDIVEDYDVIYFGKSFDEKNDELRYMLEDLKKLDKTIYLINTRFCNIGKFNDPIYHTLNNKISRKKLKINYDEYNITIYGDYPILSDDISYFSILKIGNNKLIDLLKK